MSKVVLLKIYFGKASYDENGNLISESQNVKWGYDTSEWRHNIANIRFLGISKIDILKISDIAKDGTLSDASKEDFERIKGELMKELKAVTEKPLTEEQKKIKELEEKLNTLLKGDPEEDSEIESLRAEYEAVKGKSPHHKMSAAKIKQELNK